MQKTKWLTCIFLSLSVGLLAQPEPRFEKLADEEGLSNGFVTSICQDNKGFIWFGTANGLNRYDGYQFRTYMPEKENSKSLSHQLIWTLMEDSKGYLWVGTDLGLNRFDPALETFSRFYHEPDNDRSLTSNLIETVFEDHSGDMWVGTANGLNRLKKGTKDFIRYFYEPGTKDGRQTRGVFEDKEGRLWIGSLDTLYRFDRRTERFIPFPLPIFEEGFNRGMDFIRVIYQSSDGYLWIGTDKNGLFRFDKDLLEFSVHYQNILGDIKSLSHNRITDILEDDKQNLWIATYGGGLNIPDNNAGFYHFFPAAPNDFGAKVIRGMLKDAAGNIWLGTEYEGLFVVRKHKKGFRNYTASPVQTSGLSAKGVSFYENADGKIWLGTYGGGLHYFDPATKEFTYYHHRATNPNSLPDDNIRSVVEDMEGSVWILSDAGISRWNRKTGIFTHNLQKKVEQGSACDGWLQGLHLDSKGNIWITSMDGLCKYDRLKGAVKSYLLSEKRDKDQAYLDNNYIYMAQEDRKGNVWIATQGGLNRYLEETDSFIFYPYPHWVLAIYEDRKGTLWLGTEKGLAIFSSDTIEAYDRFEKLIEVQVFNIFEDKKERLWFSSDNGIYRLDPTSHELQHYNRQDGLNSNQFLPGGIKSKTGEMYFTNSKGFTVFHPEDIRDNDFIPPLVFTDFQLFNKKVPIKGSSADTMKWESPLVKEIGNVEEIILKHWQNDLFFEFAALDFTAPENNRYQYQLECYDQHWIETDASRRFAHYTNLLPGDYVFKVKGSNSDGKWNEESASLIITIHSPWWVTWWACLLYILIGASLLFAIRRYELRRKLAKAEARRLQELDAIKTRLYTNITHEFRTPLTIILGMAEQLAVSSRQSAVGGLPFRGRGMKEGLKMIIRNGQRLLHLVNQMLDLSKLESGDMKLNLVQSDIINYLQYLTESFHSLAGSKNIRLHFMTDLEVLYMDYDPERLQHVMSNLLSNAIKFTPDERDVYISGGKEGERFEITVRDTGVGIPQEKLPLIFDRFYQADDSTSRQGEGTGIGLDLTKELVKLMNGSIQVASKVSKGTTFQITLPVTNSAPLSDDSTMPFDPAFQATVVESGELVLPTKTDEKAPLVLLIEDNADVVQYLTQCLRKEYRLEVARDGDSGIEKARNLIPDLIISDVMMPGKDGFKVCRTLKDERQTSHIPIVLLTAKADMDSRLEGLERGADVYLAKPFRKKELLIRLRKLLELRQTLQEFYKTAAGLHSKAEAVMPGDGFSNMEREFIKKIRLIVETNMANADFSVTSLNREFLMSPSKVYRKLAALTGLSPTQFIRSIRLNTGKKLLQNPDLTIANIAYDTGFTDPDYFSRLFKKEFGMTPTEFKEWLTDEG